MLSIEARNYPFFDRKHVLSPQIQDYFFLHNKDNLGLIYYMYLDMYLHCVKVLIILLRLIGKILF